MTQDEALKILKTGKSVFITGAAGAGKTHLLREYISWLMSNDISVAITASTGIAATHMGGMTIHAWSGIGIRDELTESDIDEIVGRKYIRDKIKQTEVLIIDEISMLDCKRLDMVDQIIRRVKDTSLPFGGIQVVFCGDFFQLPPIIKMNNVDSQLFEDEESHFAYHARSWKELHPSVCYLHEQYRQKDDVLLDILNALRDRKVDTQIRNLLLERKKEIPNDIATKLYAKNINVDAENEFELNKLKGPLYTYKMIEKGSPNLCLSLKRGCLAPELLRLKVGAKIMFVKNNFEKKYVNGTQGEVISLSEVSIKVKTKNGDLIEVTPESWLIEEDGKKKAEIIQYPIRLAWAITIHKSQGMSLDEAVIDLSDAFLPGMGYVALSRLKTIYGLYLIGINDSAYIMHEEVIEKDEGFKMKSEDALEYLEKIGEQEIEKKHKEFIEKSSHKKTPKLSTIEQTKLLFDKGTSISEISKERELAIGTIIDHLEEVRESEGPFSTKRIIQEVGQTKFKNISLAFFGVGTIDGGKRPLKPVFEKLKGKYDYETIRIVRLSL